MERSTRSRLSWAAMQLAVVAGLAVPPAPAQGPPPLPSGMPESTSDLMIALGRTRDQGIPTVVVVTSASSPQSGALARGLVGCSWARSTRGMVQIVELPADQNPALAQAFRLDAIPAVVAYTPGAGGPVLRGQRPCGTAEEAVAWLVSLGLPDGRMGPGAGDLGVVRANFGGGYPSPQQPQAPSLAPPAAPPLAPAPAMTPPGMTYAAPPAYAPALAYPQPMQAPASVVNLPGPNVVVQQGQPNVYVTQAAPAAAAPVGNFFLPAAAAPQPAMATPMMSPPMMAMPAMAQPAMAMPAMAQPALAMPAAAFVAAAAQPAFAAAAPAAPQPAFALNSQTLSVPTTQSKSTVRVRGPGAINSALARLGEKLVQRGRTTIETVQSTELGTPTSQGGGGLATITATNPTAMAPLPMAPPSFGPPTAPAPPAMTPPVCEAPEAPLATPQASPQSQRRAPSKHGRN